MSLRRIRLAKTLKSFRRLRLIPRFCDFGISSTFDAVLRYFPVFFAVLRYLSIFSAVLRCSSPPNVPLLEPLVAFFSSYDIKGFHHFVDVMLIMDH